MNEVLTRDILEMNKSLDPLAVLEKMGFAGDAIYEEGDQIRIYCPIHRDIIKRSMIIERSGNIYKCQHKQCEAHGGGPLIRLYALFFGLTMEQTIEHLNSGPKDQSQLIAEADRLIDRGELSSAIPVLKKVLEEDPKNEINRCKLAALYLELGDKDGGFKEYLQAAEDFAIRGHLSKTVGIYKLLIIIAPNDISVRHNMFHIFCRLQRFEEAVEQAKFIGDQLYQRKEYDRALKVCREMLDVMPAEPTIREFLAKILLAKGDLVAASVEIENAAKLYFELRRLSEARMAISLGLEFTPNNPILLQLRDEYNQSSQVLRASEYGERRANGRGQMSERDFSGWVRNLETEVNAVEEVREEDQTRKTISRLVRAAKADAPAHEKQPDEPDGADSNDPQRSLEAALNRGAFVDEEPIYIDPDQPAPVKHARHEEAQAEPEPYRAKEDSLRNVGPAVPMGPAPDSQVILPGEINAGELTERVQWIKGQIPALSETQVHITQGYLNRIIKMAEIEHQHGNFSSRELDVLKDLYKAFNIAVEQVG